MMNFLIWVWDGIKYFFGILGSIISFKLSFIFLLCIAFYTYKLVSGIGARGVRHKEEK